MRIEIIRSTVCDGVVVAAGEIVEASDQDALTLLRMGKAIPAKEKAPESAAIETPEKAVKNPPKNKNTGKAVKDGAEESHSG